MSTSASPPAPPDLLLLISPQDGLKGLGEALAASGGAPATLLIALDRPDPEWLRLQLGLGWRWAAPGTVLHPGTLSVAWPDLKLESTPDGPRVTGLSLSSMAAPLDALLTSVAQIAGPRSLTVILGSPELSGSAGLQTLSASGGTVLTMRPDAPGLTSTLKALTRPAPPPGNEDADGAAVGILERMGDAHSVLDGAYVIRSVNAAAERLLGMPRSQLIDRSHWEAFPASVDAPVGRALRRVVEDGTEQHLTHHYMGEGYDLHLEVDVYPTSEGGAAMFWRDVTERVRAEAALRASEEKYRALFTEMDEAYAVVEVLADEVGRWVDFRFLDANPPFMRHTGMPYPVGRTATDLLGTPNPRWAQLYGRVAETGLSLRVEEQEFMLGRVFDLNIFRLGGEGSRQVAVLFTDISERKAAESARRAREERQVFLLELGDALRAQPDEEAIARLCTRRLAGHLHLDRCYVARLFGDEDRTTVGPEYHRSDLAPAGGEYRLSDFPEVVRQVQTRTVVIGDVAGDPALTEKDKAALGAIDIGAFVTAGVREGHERVLWALVVMTAGPRVWAPDEVALVEEVAERTWAAIERVRAEAARQASEERFRAVANLVPDLLWESRPDGFTTWYNQRWLEYTGQTLEEASGWGWTDAISEEDREDSARRYRQSVETGQVLRQEHRIRRHDGTYRWFVVQTAPVRNAAGEVTRVYGAATDIHDLRELATGLETRVGVRTRQLTGINAELMARTRALEGFAHLTRDLGLETDRAALIRRAQELAMSLLPDGFAAYYEPEGDVWRLHSQVGATRNPALQALMDAGLPLNSPSFIHPFRSGQAEYQAAYVPGTDTAAELAEHVHSTAALPVRLGGAPLGLFAVVQFTDQMWTPADRALLETVVQHLNLALERAESVRRLAEEREALRAFAQFTELAARTSDVRLLAQQATDVLHQVLGADLAVYLEREGEVWKPRASAGPPTPTLQRLMGTDLPAHLPSFMMAAARRQPMFFEHLNAEQAGPANLKDIQALAVFPLFPSDHLAGMLSAVKLGNPDWRDRERAIFQAVGEAFRLALERTAQVQQIERQRGRLADLNVELGTLITRTAHQLDKPARQLEEMLSPDTSDAALQVSLSVLDPALLHDEIKRLRAVAQDLRELSVLEVQPLAAELLALGELVDEARRQTRDPGREVTWFTEPLPVIRGDRAMLQQALHVLMTFTLSPTRGARFVTVSSREAEGEVRLAIEDDGVGLSGEEAATLFDVAVRTDQSVPLLEGGGLVQVRRILARHGGWAWAEGQRTGGRVVLAFPQEAAAGDLDALLLGDGPRP